jgi:hypothetical protein
VLANIVLKRIEEKENEKSFWSKVPLINKIVS